MTKFGITETELERYKQATVRAYERLAAQTDEHPSATLADEYVRNFMEQEPIPGIAYELALVKRFLPTLTLAEVNGIAKTWMPDRNRVVAVSAPQKAGVPIPDEAKLSAIITGGSGSGLTAYVDTVTSRPLVEHPPTPGRIVKTEERKHYGITEWTLSNGARVVLKPTTFSRDQILFRAFSPGGTSLASDADFIAADTAEPGRSRRAAWAAGRGSISARRWPATPRRSGPRSTRCGKASSAAATRTISRRCSSCIYLTVAEPRADPDAFRAMVTQLQATLVNRNAEPEAAFNDALNAALTQNHPPRAAADHRAGRADEPREVAGVLQGSLRRPERLHVRVRRQLRPRRRSSRWSSATSPACPR